ncbi:hypothetical protein [Eubacterium sp. 1001713B170207_170306_E7]|uniref:hypothetical protein n=1 Tax=Eubacterium sp. 1001713B170207_170306_E7 TaxID=2787097 RepID=UPI001898C991|nr:hypothetical protein [Eubacterium sp. 1001713B170207_170306_E7]
MKTEVKKKNKASLTLYIVAVLFGIYAIFSLINTALYISNLISTQYITVSESLTDIIVYFVTNCGPYIFYAAALGGLGYLVEMAARSGRAETPLDEMQIAEPGAVLPEASLSPVVETTVAEAVADEAETEAVDGESAGLQETSEEAEAMTGEEAGEQKNDEKENSEPSDMKEAI